MLKRVRFFVSLVIFGLVAFCDWVKSAVKIKMGTIIDNTDGTDGEKRDLDDSGCVQDGSPPAMEPRLAVNLLDLSDDVLLYILRHCSPRDLKALGFSCSRLGRLVRERSLWRNVDARAECCGVARFHWYVAHALHADTKQLAVRGYADESTGCLGMLNCSRQEAEDEQKSHQGPKAEGQGNGTAIRRSANFQRHHACLYISSHSAPGLLYRRSPLWSEAEGEGRRAAGGCCGPRFTVTEPLLRGLRSRCVRLTRLALERCNVNCNTINLSHLPPTLTHLSLRGTRCYNLPMDKSFLFKIQDHLPLLESLDVSECEWLEPASLLPLSKHARLRELLMRDCHRLTEFVAYASLSSRYGFRSLQVLDLRGSPVGDSEVAPLAWLPRLEELRLAAGAPPPAPHAHGHYVDDDVQVLGELDEWEMQEPDYLRGHDKNGDGPAQRDRDWGDGEGDGDGDDDDDDDMNGGGSSAIRKPNLPEHGECSKSKRDSTTTKRKAENGSGDAGVNGEQSKPKRKKSDKREKSDKNGKNDSSSSDDDSSKDSEEEMYEKRRCQTIVIVDRRYISDNEDISFGRFARRFHGELRNQRLEAEIARARNNEASEQQNGENGEEGGDKAKSDEKDKKPDDKRDEPEKSNKANDDKVNEGASTSKENNDDKSNDKNNGNNNGNDRPNEEGERYVRFRQGENPVIVNLAERPDGDAPERIVRFNSYNIRHEVIDNQQIFNVEIERCSMHGPRAQPNPEGNGEPQAPQGPERPQAAQGQGPQADPPPERQLAGFHQALEAMQRQAMERARLRDQNPNIMNLIRGEPVDLPPPLAAFPPPGNAEENWEPRHRVLYVNVGQPANAIGPLPNVIQGLVSDRENRILNLSRGHINPSSLVTDAAVRRFGRAAGNDIRFVLVGIPHPVLGPNNDGSARPERSNLRVLVMNGYRNITDRSLVHLATAAPHLQYLDFRETNVTAEGVENFRSLRPDCEVLFSPYVERKDQWPDEDE